jgi:quinol-cytochrome oxidoreductase complex cytochrome b subunit
MMVPRPNASVPAWLRFLRQRVPVNVEVFEELSKEPIPNHMKNWWYCLGGTPLMLLAVQAVTGILLTFYYVPSPDQAWNSVRAINEELPYGWWIRSVHHWAAHLMIIAVILHLLRVFFTGAYRRPRELNWIVGVALLFLTLGFGFTGYALVYDQLSYWAATVGLNIVAQVPLAGPWMADVMRGGPTVGDNTLTRFFVFHVGALPSLTVIFLGLHIFLLRVHGVMELEAPREVQETPITVEEDLEGKRRFDPNRFFAFFPDHVTTELLFGLFLLTLITLLAILFPASLGPAANAAETPLHIRPEWYFYPAFRWLKLVPASVGVAGALLFVLVLIAWPFLEEPLRRRRREREDSVWIGAAVATVLLALLVWEALS